jgi:hypothetical protein
MAETNAARLLARNVAAGAVAVHAAGAVAVLGFWLDKKGPDWFVPHGWTLAAGLAVGAASHGVVWLLMHLREDPEPVTTPPKPEPQSRGLVCWGFSPDAIHPDPQELVRKMPFKREVLARLFEFEFPAVKDRGYVYVAHSSALGTATVGAGGIDGGFQYTGQNVVQFDSDGKRSTFALLRTENEVAGPESMRIHLRFFDLPE